MCFFWNQCLVCVWLTNAGRQMHLSLFDWWKNTPSPPLWRCINVNVLSTLPVSCLHSPSKATHVPVPNGQNPRRRLSSALCPSASSLFDFHTRASVTSGGLLPRSRASHLCTSARVHRGFKCHLLLADANPVRSHVRLSI